MATLSDLPPELFVIIANKTTIGDLMAMKAVCTTWKATLEDGIRLPPHLPLLILPNDKPQCRFYDAERGRVHRIFLPEAYDYLFCGSSHGWLVAVDLTPRVFLLHPVTRHRIELPPITTFPDVLQFSEQEIGREYRCIVGYGIRNRGRYLVKRNVSSENIRRYYMKKVILTESPTLDHGYIAVAIYSFFRRLGYCRRGDDRWKFVDVELCGFCDVVYCKEKRLFYAVQVTGKLVACDLQGPNPVTKKITRSKDCKIDGENTYLAFASGELVLIVRHAEKGGDSYREERSSSTWAKIQSIGDHVLFVGINNTMCFPSRVFPRCKNDHVYYTDDFLDYHKEGVIGGYDLGVMSLKTNERRQVLFGCCEELGKFVSPLPIWVVMPIHGFSSSSMEEVHLSLINK